MRHVYLRNSYATESHIRIDENISKTLLAISVRFCSPRRDRVTNIEKSRYTKISRNEEAQCAGQMDIH